MSRVIRKSKGINALAMVEAVSLATADKDRLGKIAGTHHGEVYSMDSSPGKCLAIIET